MAIDGPHQRARYLFTINDLIETHTDELAELVTLDNGKPIGEAIIEVGRTADTFRYYAGWAMKFYGEINPSDPGIFNYTLREPIRVCGQIIPWNGWLATISWKIAPASAFGNPLVLKLAREEIFGPVAVLIRFKDENDAVFQSNDTTYGLAAAVWTRDISRAHKVARALKSGTVWVNCYGVIDAAMPVGGYKQSGFGREGSQHVLDLFTQIKSVYVKL